MPKVVVQRVFGAYEPPIEGGKWGNRLGASIDNYQASLYGVGEALTGSDWMRRRREENEADAEWQRENARRLGAVSSYKDIGGVGDFFDYAGGLAVDSLPYAGEAILGGLTGGSSVVAGGLARAGLSRAAARTLGGVAASYPSSVGDILQNQREQSGGQTNVGAALAGGVPYAALNALGIEGALARGTLTRSGIKALDSMTGAGGVAARTGVSMLKNAAIEGPAETGQEFVNQSFGRMAVDPNETFWNDESKDRYAESFVGGATLGGLFGGAAGGWRRSEGYLPPGSDLNNPERPADLLAQSPRLDSDAQYGLQGDLFDGAGYDTTTDGSRGAIRQPTRWESDGQGGAVPVYGEPLSADIEQLRSDLGQLTTMADAAYKAGDRDQLESLNAAIQQTQQQIMALSPADRTPSRMLGSGVHEIVSGRPVELTEDELANNLLPFVGDTNIDFPIQQGLGFQYEGGVDPEGLYTPVQEGRQAPNLVTQLDPLQQRIDQNLGIAPGGVGRQTRQNQLNAAANEGSGQWTQDANGIERELTVAELMAIQSGEKLDDRALIAEAEKTRAEVERRRTRATQVGLKGDKAADTWAELEELHSQGAITAGELAENLGLLQANKRGQVEKFLKGKAAQEAAVAENDAATQQAVLDAVKPKVTPEARAAWDSVRKTNASLPAVETLNDKQVGELNETVTKGFFVAPTAQTIADMGKAKPAAKPETADDLTFIDDLVSGRSNVSPADAALLQRWLGVQVNENGELEVSEEGAASYTTLGATLTDEKTGKKGISRQAVEGRIQRALKAAGAPSGLTRERVAERIAARAAGTDMDTMQRSVDMATPAEIAPLDGTATETADGRARAAEMEAGTNDDVGAQEEGTTDTTPEALLEQQAREEAGTLRTYLKDDLQEGRVLESDIGEVRFFFEQARGPRSFTSNSVSRQAEAVRQYARARLAGDPVVTENQKAFNEQSKAQTRVEPAAGNPEADGRGNQADTGVEPAAAGSTGRDLRPGRQVPQAGDQAQAPVVKVRKARSVSAPPAADTKQLELLRKKLKDYQSMLACLRKPG